MHDRNAAIASTSARMTQTAFGTPHISSISSTLRGSSSAGIARRLSFFAFFLDRVVTRELAAAPECPTERECAAERWRKACALLSDPFATRLLAPPGHLRPVVAEALAPVGRARDSPVVAEALAPVVRARDSPCPWFPGTRTRKSKTAKSCIVRYPDFI
jgi:hypothetical protein